MKKNINFPIFDSFEEMMFALKKQSDYNMRKLKKTLKPLPIDSTDVDAASRWIKAHPGDSGEESMELLTAFGIPTAGSAIVTKSEDAAAQAQKIGYPVVLKVVSPDALHKSEAGGVIVGLRDDEAVKKGFETIRKNLGAYKKDARFDGVRVVKMADEGYDMFIGGRQDASFGPVIFFGFGGIYIEVFKDVRLLLCPAGREEISEKVKKLKSYNVLKGARGRKAGDIDAYIAMIERVSHLLARFPEILELDVNPVRILEDGSGAVALDARVRVG
jgi:acyl-CoA synthetase (NDP forming)